MFKDLLKLIIWSIFFTIVVFFIKTTIFTSDKILIEQKYIEPTVELKDVNKWKKLIDDILYKKEKSDLNSASKYYFVYIPWNIKNSLKNYKQDIETYITNKNIFKFISDLRIDFYEKMKDRRWKMKNRNIKLFNPIRMWQSETLNVFIHEFWHYIDLYYLDNKWWFDLSNDFYNISWNSTTVLKRWQSQADFVSGYAMTNKYEDFAESFIYFVIDNNDFLIKSETSEFLAKKYNFFTKNVFVNNFLKNTKFTNNLIIKDYYRDMTKLNLNLKKFLLFLKK